jgi:protein-arginine kinase activator protein McsA
MDEVYVCQTCGLESTEDTDFKTDLNNTVDIDDMTCESCYDDFNGDGI